MRDISFAIKENSKQILKANKLDQNNNKTVTRITYDSHDELVVKSFEEIYNEVDKKLNIKINQNPKG